MERWHCRSCAKVSEGFAFPYGGCPLCGGELELVEPRPAEGSAARNAVRKAFEIELGGQAFYHRAVASASDPSMRELFARFAAMEREHMDTLAARYRVDLAPVFDAHAVEHAVIFAGVDRRLGDAEDLFRIAIDMEERAAQFFEVTAARSAPGSTAERLYRELAAEEREHARILRTEHARWRAGNPVMLGGARDDGDSPEVASINAAKVLLDGLDDAREALVCGNVAITRGQLRDAVAREGTKWRARGVRGGDRVAIKLADGVDWVVAYLGVIWAGGVAVGVNPRVPAAEWLAILDAAGFLFVLADAAEDTPPPWRAQVVTLADWKRELAHVKPRDAHPMRPGDPAFWVHSSGTSGHPKAVVHAQRSVLEIERVGRERLGIVAEDRIFASSKLFFSYPLANALFTGLKTGATVVLDPQWPNAAGVAATALAQRATVLFSVPALYRSLLKEGYANALAQSGVRRCVSAGEALPSLLREEWKRQTGCGIVDGYGASETMVLVLVDDDGEGLRASPGIEIRALGPSQEEVPARIVVHGPTVALGYWNRPDAQAEHFREGDFSPADLFIRDEAGRFRFAGREDSLVKVHGRWVDLIALEQQLAVACPGLAECAAVAVPDDDGVTAIALFFVAQPGVAVPDPPTLREHADRLPHHQRPRWLHPIEFLPRTPTGKLMRRRLREMHRAEESHACY